MKRPDEFLLTARAVAPAGACSSVVSLPVPPFDVTVSVQGASAVQAVPLGHWPARLLANPKQTWPWPADLVAPPKPFGGPPRRLLVYARFPGPAPESLSLRLAPAAPQQLPGAVPVSVRLIPGPESYHHRDEELYHYVKREDSALISAFGRDLSLRLGFRVNGQMRYWQWIEAIPVWDGPLTRALVVGGHIYAGAEDRPLTMAESKRVETTPFHDEAMVSAKAFLVLHAGGSVQMTVHFTNTQSYGMGSQVHGLPVVEVSSNQPLHSSAFTVDEGEASLAAEGKTWLWTPVPDTRVWLGHRWIDGGPACRHEFVEGSEKGFVKGVARSSSCAFSLSGAIEAPRRFLAEPAWYKRCAEFGVALPDLESGFEKLQALSDAAAPVFLRNVCPSGMSKGGVFRYLDQPNDRHELSMDGNEASFLFRGAYLRSHPELYRLAMDAARHVADICVDHYDFNVHYHADYPAWNVFSMIYLRFGGLVQAWQETGDPWFLENAEAVANRWIALNRMNQPRKNMGRDTEPVEGILMLHDATGKDHYFVEAEKIALDVAHSLFEDHDWRCGHGVGPFWGINALRGSPWNGSHLLAGVAEFLARACPATSLHYDALLSAAAGLVDKLLQKVRDDCDGFHRATGSFLPRRHFLVALMAGNETLMAEVLDAARRLEAEFTRDGEAFYRTGHHCAGYLEAPAVLRSLAGRPAPWLKRPAKR